MILKEKIQTIIIDDYGNLQKILLLEKMAEDFSCDFLAWFKNQVFLHCEWSVFDLSEKEILEIYKKEKGL